LSEIILVLTIVVRDTILNVYIDMHVKYPLFLSEFNEFPNVSADFGKNNLISNFINLCPVGSKLFHADGLTDMSSLIVAFRNFAEVTDNCGLILVFENISLRTNVMRRNM